MRNMSFNLTAAQVRMQIKTVTRRIGWRFLEPGDLLQPVLKAQGLRRGDHITKIGGPIRVVSVRREPLDLIVTAHEYGVREVEREGFGGKLMGGTPLTFLQFFCSANNCEPAREITRIEFEYV